MKHRFFELACLIGLALTWGARSAADEVPSSKKTGKVKISDKLVIDFDNKEVVLDAKVVLREGPLELLVCPVRTKEHESILAAEVAPRSFQLALLGVGAMAGAPAKFEPAFEPARGEEIAIEVEYTVNGKTVREDAREWVRQLGKEGEKAKVMDAGFVFAGSRFARASGERRAHWLGDDGDLVSVANFPGSIIDVSVRSDNANAYLLFEAWTDRIPAVGTPVRVIFKPTGKGRPVDPQKP